MIELRLDLNDLDKKLGKLPAVMERRIVRKSLRKAANILKKQARENAPYGSYDRLTGTDKFKKGHVKGTLKKSIVVRESSKSGRASKVQRTGVAGRVSMYVETTHGPGARHDAWYAHIIEFGAQPHSIKTGASVRKGSTQTGKLHPGIKPVGFMRKALDQTGARVIDETGKQISINLNREIDKL